MLTEQPPKTVSGRIVNIMVRFFIVCVSPLKIEVIFQVLSMAGRTERRQEIGYTASVLPIGKTANDPG